MSRPHYPGYPESHALASRWARLDAGRAAPPGGNLDASDALAQFALADAADASLMRLVLCAAGTTLLLALASSLVWA